MDDPKVQPHGIAVIGMAGRFPGAKTIQEFWQNLRDGRETIAHFSEAELIAAGIPSAWLEDPHYVRAGARLAEIEWFDAQFFNCSPREAELLDPQHRLLLESAWEALETAGYAPGSQVTGVYVGSNLSAYLLRNLSAHPQLVPSMLPALLISNSQDYAATRISYKLNLKGPSLTISTSCSTSLVAVHAACQSLLNYECDLAIAGGVSIQSLQPEGYLHLEGGMASPDGHCRAFDAKAQGTVFGDGVGLVVLKRLEEAIADGDQIAAVIRGSAVNNDGSAKVGYTAPSVGGQAQVIAEAQAIAAVSPDTISYIETHGTGTALGDPIEISALTKVFGASTARRQFCAIGSVKTNLGHLNTAAGVTGLIKTILALHHQQIPPSLHFQQPNPEIDFANSPFYVNTALADWPRSQTPRRAGVSSFGVGGTNVHVVLEEAPRIAPAAPAAPAAPWQLLLLSAKTSSALAAMTANLAEHLRQHPALNLADVAYTLQTGRSMFDHRCSLVCRDLEEARRSLVDASAQRRLSGVAQSADQSIAFLFPGQGSHYVNMGRDLYESQSTFRHQVDHCAELLRSHLAVDLRHVLYPDANQIDAANQVLQATAIAQPALFVVEYALAQLWQSWGIQPAALIGHSLGEYVAATLAGVFSLEDALMLVALRGRLMQQQPAGAMLALSLSEQQLQPLLDRSISLAAINAPSACVVSGPLEAIATLQQQLIQQGVDCRRLHTSHAFHSWMMEPALPAFAAAVQQVDRQPPTLPLISNVTGTWMTAAEATDPHYWANQIRQPVQFGLGLTTLMSPNPILLEVGPGQTLSRLAKLQLTSDRLVLASLPQAKATQSALAVLLNALGQLWVAGAPIDWSAFHADQRRQRLALPTYPFERRRYWLDAASSVPNEIPTEPAQLNESPPRSPAAARYSRPSLDRPYTAPTSSLEIQIAELWQDILGIQQVGIDDNFFDLGGDSLIATQLAARLQALFPVELPLRDLLLNALTVAQQAEAIETLLLEKIAALSDEEAARLLAIAP